jgi:DNA-directed RNA polymerase specialized sigma24 family protein
MRDQHNEFHGSGRFPTTSWTLIVNTSNLDDEVSREALSRLCSSYWLPVFFFIRRKGLDPDQAKDCTQDFFTVLLEKDYLAGVAHCKGNFRSFLLAAVTHFLANRFESERAQKRGGGQAILSLDREDAEGAYRNAPANSLTPEELFEYRWATSLLECTLERLRSSYAGADFDLLKPFLTGEESHGEGVAVAQRLSMSAGAFKVAVHRLRKRYRDLLRAEIAKTVADRTQVDEEIRYLLLILTRGDRAL